MSNKKHKRPSEAPPGAGSSEPTLPASGEENLAPETIPAPAPDESLSEAHGFPSPRRCSQE